MKKILILLALICISLIPCAMVYAQEETTETTIVEEVSEVEQEVERITDYVIAGVLGLLGTSAVAVGCRKGIKVLVTKVVDSVSLVKETKAKADEDINNIKNEVESQIASLKTLKEDMLKLLDEMLVKVQAEGVAQREAILTLANGFKELVVNGTSETISNILQVTEKTNGSEEI